MGAGGGPIIAGGGVCWLDACWPDIACSGLGTALGQLGIKLGAKLTLDGLTPLSISVSLEEECSGWRQSLPPIYPYGLSLPAGCSTPAAWFDKPISSFLEGRTVSLAAASIILEISESGSISLAVPWKKMPMLPHSRSWLKLPGELLVVACLGGTAKSRRLWLV